MKTNRIQPMKLLIANILLTTAGVLCAQRAMAQPYSIDWHTTTGGGGGTSTGGVFAVSGTIGQSDAGALSGGIYSLAGGFWGAIPTPPPAPTVIELRVVGGEVHLRFNGIPGRTYDIERARFVTGSWPPQPLATITMPSGGVVEFTDITAFSFTQSFYRTRLR